MAAGPAAASPANPVAWSARVDPVDARAGEAARVLVRAIIDPGWHIYSLTQKEGGPQKTTLALKAKDVLSAAGKPAQPVPIKENDASFGMTVETFRGTVDFALPVKLAPAAKPGPHRAIIAVGYMVCNARNCLPPKTFDMPVLFRVASGRARPSRLKPVLTAPKQAVALVVGPAAPAPPGGISQDPTGRRIKQAENSGLIAFLGLALAAGFLALLTPCVFPMIPITVSFFTKQQGGDRGTSIRMALAYCLGIVATFTALGLLLTALFGASGIARFATNPVVNLAMAALFIVLAINLFGVFELTLPSGLINRTAQGSRSGRYVGPLLMGLTFTLTSFTCTVPFVGTLLATASRGNALWPVLGMLAFSTAFASPFFLLALFPQMLAGLPRSGAWLVSVKATMGFLELAAALKFLSNADLVWQAHLLTRPVFLAVWAGIAAVAGCYLLGWLLLPHGVPDARIGPLRRLIGVGALASSVACLAALGGANLGDMDAYLPPANYGRLASARPVGSTAWLDDYDQAVAQAKAQGKSLFINFTGYTCTNCRWMESHVLNRPDVMAELARFVPLELYTDGQGPEFDRNRKLEQDRFGTVALPLYAVMSPDGTHVHAFGGLTRNPAEFLAFLRGARPEAVASAAP